MTGDDSTSNPQTNHHRKPLEKSYCKRLFLTSPPLGLFFDAFRSHT